MPSRSTLVVLALVPVVAPAALLLVVQAVTTPYVAAASTATRVLTKKDGDSEEAAAASTTTTTPTAAGAADVPPPHALPAAVLAPDAPYVVTCERLVSRPVPAVVLGEKPSAASLLTTYLRGTLAAFRWTPQGLLLDALTRKDPAAQRTFNAAVLHSLPFAVGDRAVGIHEVAYRGDDADNGSSRVELILLPLPGWPRLSVHALIVAEAVYTGDRDVVFVNETWMWRLAETEAPTLLESAAGRWVHRLVGSWMLFRGTKAVTAPVVAATGK